MFARERERVRLDLIDDPEWNSNCRFEWRAGACRRCPHVAERDVEQADLASTPFAPH
jgi:hypothetical protein